MLDNNAPVPLSITTPDPWSPSRHLKQVVLSTTMVQHEGPRAGVNCFLLGRHPWMMGRWVGTHRHTGQSRVGFLMFIDVCASPPTFLVSLLVGEGGPAQAV